MAWPGPVPARGLCMPGGTPSGPGRQAGASCSRCRCPSSHLPRPAPPCPPCPALPPLPRPAPTQKFNNWIDEQRAASPQPGLSVYPEGHRSTLGESLPLKRGMLHYAYSRKLPVQVVIGANKEAIISEKHCTARLNQTAVVGYSGGWLRGGGWPGGYGGTVPGSKQAGIEDGRPTPAWLLPVLSAVGQLLQCLLLIPACPTLPAPGACLCCRAHHDGRLP